jgi:hypothetical protein
MFGIESQNLEMQSHLDYVLLHHNIMLQNQSLGVDNNLLDCDGMYGGITSQLMFFATSTQPSPTVFGAAADESLPMLSHVSTPSNFDVPILQFINMVNEYASSNNTLIAGTENIDLELIDAKPSDNLVSIDDIYAKLMNSEEGKQIKEKILSTYSDSEYLNTEKEISGFNLHLDLILRSSLSSRLLLEQNLNLLSQISDPDSPVHDPNSPERKALEYGLACAVDDGGEFVGMQSHGVDLGNRSITSGFTYSSN